MFYRPLVYIQVHAGHLTASVVGTSDVTHIPCSALAHPRTLMGEFTAIESAMKDALARLGMKAWFRRSPVVLTHLVPKAEGGYTNVELRAFREAALGAGASSSLLLADHPPLSPQDTESIVKILGRSIL